MPWTLGAATSNSISFTAAGVNTITGPSKTVLVCGWFRPTTLTATRLYWSNTPTFKLAVDTTTANGRLTIDAGTTDGVYTFPLGMVVNTWTFIAVLMVLPTAGALDVTAIKVWTGDGINPLVSRTVSQTTLMVGSVAAGTTAFFIGNDTGLTLSFQGDVDAVTVATASTSALSIIGGTQVGAVSPFISAGEALAVQNQWVEPMYRGDYDQVDTQRRWAGNGAPEGLVLTLPPQGPSLTAALYWTKVPLLATVNTAAVATTRIPRPVWPRTSAPRAMSRRGRRSMLPLN